MMMAPTDGIGVDSRHPCLTEVARYIYRFRVVLEAMIYRFVFSPWLLVLY